jgi:sialic acid synthase SpsE
LENISSGEIITKDKLTYRRPGTGIAPDEVDNLIGKKAKVDIQADSMLKWDEIE